MKNKYNVKNICYTDIYGNLLWKDKMQFRRLYAVGDEIIENYKSYIVERVALFKTTQYVNLRSLS